MPKTPTNWKFYWILILISFLSTLAVLPYAFTLSVKAMEAVSLPLPLVMAISAGQSTVLFAIAIFLGLKLAKKMGLKFTIFEEYLVSKKLPKDFTKILKTSVLCGVGAGVLIILFDFVFTKLNVGISLWTGQMPPAWMGLLASFYGGINEEFLLRLFLMTLIVWVCSKFYKSDTDITQKAGIMWVAIIISTIIFGLGHLPITGNVTSISAIVVVRAIVLNGIGGIIFGWLYWKKGLESAMIAHFSADIVLHFLMPILLLAF